MGLFIFIDWQIENEYSAICCNITANVISNIVKSQIKDHGDQGDEFLGSGYLNLNSKSVKNWKSTLNE